MKKIRTRIATFCVYYRKVYAYLYDFPKMEYTESYYAAMDVCSKVYNEHNSFMKRLFDYEKDLPTSDREYAAFGYTYAHFLGMDVKEVLA